MIQKTIMIFLITFLGYSEWLLGTSYLQRPIILGPLVGLVMGNLTEGIIMGATLELAMVGAVSVGAYNPPDLISGTVLGVSLAIESHAGAAAALTLGIPVATIMLAMNTAFGQPLMLILIHRCDKNAEQANTRAFTRNMLLAGWVQNWCGIIFIPLAFYFGSSFVTGLLGNIPKFIQTGMNIAAGLLPALGFAMLAQMIINKKVAAFFFLGFFIVSYGGISTTGVAIFATILAILMYIFVDKPMEKLKNKSPKEKTTDSSTRTGGGFDEF
jgi:fructoselysine and glucoselysine-specific PTS system IIC component